MRNEEIVAILSDANLASLRNIENIYGGGNASILELVVTLRCLLSGVLCDQSWTPAQKASSLYVATCARNRRIVGGIPSHFRKGGAVVCMGEKEVVSRMIAEAGVSECAPSL